MVATCAHDPGCRLSIVPPSPRCSQLIATHANHPHQTDTPAVQIMEGPPFKLLEAAAAALCARVLSEEPAVAAVRVHLRKPHVALRGPLESVGVEITRGRG
jgi:dihydroneopterin aldolase